MTCPADAFNSGDGLVVLEPGEEWTGTPRISPGYADAALAVGVWELRLHRAVRVEASAKQRHRVAP